MAKTKTPFFSLGAHGSVGEAITAQKRGKETLVREKPLPTDPYSLPQAYQRWNYQNVAYLWTQQTIVIRQQFASAGVRFHLTGFQYWMKVNLPLFTDIRLVLRMDEKTGNLARDSSLYGNDFTIFGASPITGRINSAFDFDGLNDRLYLINPPTLRLTGDTTWEWFTHRTAYQIGTICQKFATQEWLFYLDAPANGQIRFQHGDGIGVETLDFNLASIPLNAWTHVALVRTESPKQVHLYRNGLLIQTKNYTKTIAESGWPVYIGALNGTSTFLKATLDQFAIHSRALDPAEILMHSERSYPSE